MSTSLNPNAFTFAKRLIENGEIDNNAGHWGEQNPDAAEENSFLQEHEYEVYSNWHLGLDMSKGEHTKARYKFPYGDFRTVHRQGLTAAKQRAAQQGYMDIEKAADKLLQLLEKQTRANP
ncbi:hypothetical protein I2I05_09765 [Hymenobacter sp. BT683]|uniref:Uncharacterized protein n=1 Tax=Hymenobacter jeongseonensis TaxID=2791027 RepID=A0ABS0IIQ4_9BACT|nr:hypothetical protein [Hymenobacter jeongseonensis]MBF9237680.1 hypothetical protein [Hymenobacter jeongseonensis]